jgi:hypothetical protein
MFINQVKPVGIHDSYLFRISCQRVPNSTAREAFGKNFRE